MAQAGSNLKWYADANGSTGSSTAITPSTSTIGIKSYYVTQTVNGCESQRAEIIVTINLCGRDSDCDGILDANDLCPGGDDKIDNNHDGKPDCRYLPNINQLIAAWRCGNNNDKVVICHIPPGNPANRQTLCVSANAVAAHLAHGDYIGSCDNAKCTNNLSTSNILAAYAHSDLWRANITWVTNLGYKTDYFEILKLDNVSGQFMRLVVVNNKYFDNQTYSYNHYETETTEEEHFYRVKAVHNDGSSTLSEILKVHFAKLNDFTIFPNPANDEAWIDLKSFEGRTLDITMSDVAGKIIRREKVDKATAAPYRLDLIGIQSGSYTLTIQTRGKRTVVRKLSILK